MECPKCRLINSDAASRCDCGYVFATGVMEGPSSGTRGRAIPSPARAEDRGGGRYGNLLAVSSSIRSYGSAIKIFGFLIGAGAVVSWVAAGSNTSSLAGVGIGLLIAFAVHSWGMLVCALGEGLLALADIAMNTADRR